MTSRKQILWYGEPPQAGVDDGLKKRGFTISQEPVDSTLGESLLSACGFAVLNHGAGSVETALEGYRQIPKFVNHGIVVIVLASNSSDWHKIRELHLVPLNSKPDWIKEIIFSQNLVGLNIDIIVEHKADLELGRPIVHKLGLGEDLREDEGLLVSRAFPKAEEVHINEIKGGFTDSRVFMAYEKRRVSSIAHWAQPRLIKIGDREDLAIEVGNMKAVSPFVPFELRPNLDIFVKGFRRSIFVADFVDKSESMLQVARAGRAETAISNLFNRTLHRWRERAWHCNDTEEPLVLAAQRLGMISPELIAKDYTESPEIQKLNVDINVLWAALAEIKFKHRAASIHGDLHGDNVRVRGDDAILIDLGSVKGTDQPGEGAPLCFDVAMLEVALVFTCTEAENDDRFKQPDWESELRPFYKLSSILSTPGHDKNSAPKPDSWLAGCLQRMRAFGIYEQSNPHEYAIALVIAMWRWCKFAPRSLADKGRRVVALQVGIELAIEIIEKMEALK
jgi:hypothetical protein